MEGMEKLVKALAPTGLTAPTRRLHDARTYQLAMQWPTLAAALAVLLEEHGTTVPGPLRHARNAERIADEAVLYHQRNVRQALNIIKKVVDNG